MQRLGLPRRKESELEENRVCYHLSCRNRTISLRSINICMKGIPHPNKYLWLKGNKSTCEPVEVRWAQINLFKIWTRSPVLVSIKL